MSGQSLVDYIIKRLLFEISSLLNYDFYNLQDCLVLVTSSTDSIFGFIGQFETSKDRVNPPLSI
jgi:hypothetical protein